MAANETRLRAVLFDFGGVIAEEGFRDGLHVIARDNGHDPDTLHRAGIDAIYACGYVTAEGTEADFWRLLRERFPLRGGDADLTRTILEHFVVRPEMIALVRELRRRGLACAILSDQTDWLERLDRRDGFECEFDRVYCSYRIGKSKRDASLFDDVLADMDVHPAEAVFLDDDPGNVERARSRGLHVFRCDNAEGCRDGLLRLLDPGLSA